jgi:hypothetical protein
MKTERPSYDEIVLTRPPSPVLCNSLACSRARRLADVIVTYGVLNYPGASRYARGALWNECWGTSVPMCATYWDACRQVAARRRPELTIYDGDLVVALAGQQPAEV